VLATDRVRFVGELIAACIADDRASAEDLCDQVNVDITALNSLTGAEAADSPDAVRLHDHWPDNRYMTLEREFGDVGAAAARAAISITREYTMARVTPCAMEPRGCVAHYDARQDQLVIYLSSQRPHLIRSFLAEQLIGVDERRIRVIAPDLGGGFGGKANLYPEELLLAALAMRLDYPIRWIEDRYEHLVSAAQAREHRHRIVAHAAADGEILALEADILADGGAYSMRPSTGATEVNMTANVMPGPYRINNYRYSAATLCTNKTPIGPFRGVGRPSACFAMERTIEEVAGALGLEVNAVRLRNMIGHDEFPYTTATGLVYDSGDFRRAVVTAEAAIGHGGIRAEQAGMAKTSRSRIGVGYGFYTEQTAHGAEEWSKRGAAIGCSYESARVRLHPSGTLSVDVGTINMGQGLETTLAQIASEAISIPYDSIAIRFGDTEVSPFGPGSVASRSLVTSGGAVHHACRDLALKIRRIAAAMQDCDIEDLRLEDGRAVGPSGATRFADIANAAYLNLQRLPQGVDPSLESLFSYRAPVETGAYAAGMHAAKVAVDLDTGQVTLLDYLVVEDCGRVVNPMIVDGQMHGGVAQGIGQALFEAIRHDGHGQPTSVTFAEYLLPGATDVPAIRIEHQETLCPFTVFGMKGTGEGGCIAPPAAIGNAITDALREFGVCVCTTPMTPASIWLALDAAGSGLTCTRDAGG
jgi:carbon-monoxide dehydrogenase large subunit